MNDKLRFYDRLSYIKFPSSYLGKLMLIAFWGVHVPLLSIILYVAMSANTWAAAMPILIVGVISTVAGSAVTMVMQHRALAPMLEVSAALNQYLEDGTLPSLPTHYRDDAGQLMAHVQYCVTHLDSLLRMKRNVLAILSHDLRNPITGVLLGAEMIKRELSFQKIDHSRFTDHVDTIQAMSHTQLERINNTLTLVQSESGNLSVNPTLITPQCLLRQVFLETRLQAEEKGIQLKVDIESAPTTEILLDIAKTSQVITNLISNGIKFTPSGGELTVLAAITDDEVIFRVRDNGVGMDEATHKDLFKPFSRAQRAGTAKETGTGLGLWICKTFVEAQGGEITVESTVGQGSCFTIILHKRVGETNTMTTASKPYYHLSGLLQPAL